MNTQTIKTLLGLYGPPTAYLKLEKCPDTKQGYRLVASAGELPSALEVEKLYAGPGKPHELDSSGIRPIWLKSNVAGRHFTRLFFPETWIDGKRITNETQGHFDLLNKPGALLPKDRLAYAGLVRFSRNKQVLELWLWAMPPGQARKLAEKLGPAYAQEVRTPNTLPKPLLEALDSLAQQAQAWGPGPANDPAPKP